MRKKRCQVNGKNILRHETRIQNEYNCRKLNGMALNKLQKKNV